MSSKQQAKVQSQNLAQWQQKKQCAQLLFGTSLNRFLLQIEQNMNANIIVNCTKGLQKNLTRRNLVQQNQFQRDLATSHLHRKSTVFMDTFKVFQRLNISDSDSLKNLYKSLVDKRKRNQRKSQQIIKLAAKISNKVKQSILKKEQQKLQSMLEKTKPVIAISKSSRYESAVKTTTLINQRLDKLLDQVQIAQKKSQKYIQNSTFKNEE